MKKKRFVKFSTKLLIRVFSKLCTKLFAKFSLTLPKIPVKLSVGLIFLLSVFATIVLSTPGLSQVYGDFAKQSHVKSDIQIHSIEGTGSLASLPNLNTTDSADGATTSLQPFDTVTANTQTFEGLWTLYHDLEQGKVYAEIRADQLNRNFFFVATLNSGLGEFRLYRGMPLQDFPFTLRKVQETLQVVVPNVYFRSRPGDVTYPFVDEFFSDSVLASLPIVSIHEERNSLLVDLNPLLVDASPTLPDLSAILSTLNYTRNAQQSYLNKVSAFPLNLEFEASYNFTEQPGELFSAFTSLANSAAFTLSIHYSLSELPTDNGYQPRLADQRIGYFVTAYQDIADRTSPDRFVRYINRWHLEKQNPTAPLSPPKEPIVFWIENTVPQAYRSAVRQGILMWNRAFEKIGFQGAIEARQMPDYALWDPEDVRYNTIRWTDSFDGGVAIGPSRVNPFTGQILDADVLIDANFVRSAKLNYRSIVQPDPEGSLQRSLQVGLPWYQLTRNPSICEPETGRAYLENFDFRDRFNTLVSIDSPQMIDRCYGLEAVQQLAIGATTLSMLYNVLPGGPEMRVFVQQYISHLVAHEVGHVLGLRHNFHGSTLRSPEELNNVAITREQGLTGSIMDYVPVNLAPPGVEQGDYYTTVIGPYDEWAIEYGYTTLDHLSRRTAQRTLMEIAQRAPEWELAYGTDEDLWAGVDPNVNVFDLSRDPFTYSQWQMDLAQQLWETLDRRFPAEGESYTEARPIFTRILNYYFANAFRLANYIGGRSLNRYLKGDAPDRVPLEPVSMEIQHQALEILQQRVLTSDAFEFPADLVSKLPPERWLHWGVFPVTTNLEYPLVDQILLGQTLVLANLFDTGRLQRLRDTEFLYPDQAALTLPELFETLRTSIWSDVLGETRQHDLTTIPLIQRQLQRQYLNLLLNLVDRSFLTTATELPDILLSIVTFDAPEEARILARHQVQALAAEIKTTLKRSDDLDLSSQTHLQAAYDRISQVLEIS